MSDRRLCQGMRTALVMAWSLGTTVAAADWEVRYAHLRDQKPDWTESGFIPAWQIRQRDGEVTWQDDEKGNCRGHLLFARPLTVPATPVAVVVSLEYRTCCEISKPTMRRSGTMSLMVLPGETLETLAQTPGDARFLHESDALTSAAGCVVKEQGEDVTEWTAVRNLLIELPPTMRSRNDLMLVVAWAAYHQGANEHGGFRNVETKTVTEEMQRWEFWESLNTALPELAAVRKAVAAHDERDASAALATHFRQRTEPIVANPVGPTRSKGGLARADEILTHTYRLAGCRPYTFPDGIVWNADPFNYNQWPVALNRHNEWRILASAHLGTGDPKYAREWQGQLLHWVGSMPTFIAPRWVEGPYNHPAKTSLSLDAGIRMGQNWFPAFEHTRTQHGSDRRHGSELPTRPHGVPGNGAEYVWLLQQRCVLLCPRQPYGWLR